MKKTILMMMFCGALFTSASSQQNNPATEFDKVMKEEVSLIETGATVLVSSRGKVIYNKAFGKANVELNVNMQTNNVFRIASITKQFTAIAILQLMEAGKLNLEDEITKFIPDYPLNETKVTIEHLLTHTSGIRDFTTIQDSTQRGKMDFTPLQMISYFKDQHLRFIPGSRYEYSNSNYFLLGYIIEKISGKTYEQYLQDHIFRPVGMISSFYANDTSIIKYRAAGYTKTSKGLENAAMISMTQPYAAGAILSTAEDLFKWQQAVLSNKMVKMETVEKAFRRYTLSDGKEINYGYGFRFGFINESPSIWHGGLINGFKSIAMYLPKEDVYVVVLTNCDCSSPEIAAAKLAAVAIGKPYIDKEVKLANAVLETYAGLYQNGNGEQSVISIADGKMYLQRGRGPKMSVKASKQDQFFFEDALMRINFITDKTGKVEKLRILTRSSIEDWKKIDQPLKAQAEIKVDEKILEMYTGVYEVNPHFNFTITREMDKLFLQATGQEKLEIFAEANNKFFLKVNDATLEFVNESGKITKAMLKQGGRTTDAMKIK